MTEPVLVLISADAEWTAVRQFYTDAKIQPGVFGEYFKTEITGQPVIFHQGGWGKIAAAASAEDPHAAHTIAAPDPHAAHKDAPAERHHE